MGHQSNTEKFKDTNPVGSYPITPASSLFKVV